MERVAVAEPERVALSDTDAVAEVVMVTDAVSEAVLDAETV